ncbi:TVP38/TMEM64 family protein [Palleronia sp. LCG004]|uniref:TVP38/TMEM64 family protein n=1 Tax=Palleronia sp. LCG004 TaxID=3079304 RepID=UPI002942DC4A|nr:TVP38/TMEM64 family protein [Palleronia sp. LCG004]WOI56548.1 TVP38/TMEM64 family protein [Palleronia sp. LCG004]
MNDKTPNDAGPAPWLRRLPIVVIALAAIVGAFTLRDYLSFETLADNRERLLAFRDEHYLATVALFMLAYVVVVALSLPGAALCTLTGGFLFSTFPGTLYNVTAATAGAVCIFLAARWGLGDRLAARMDASEGMVSRIKAGIDENQWSMLFLVRLVPAVPFFVANLIPAFMGVAVWTFATTTFLGIIPGAIVYTSVGSGLGAVFERGETPDLGIIFEPRILLPILGLCLLAAMPMILKAVRGRKGL